MLFVYILLALSPSTLTVLQPFYCAKSHDDVLHIIQKIPCNDITKERRKDIKTLVPVFIFFAVVLGPQTLTPPPGFTTPPHHTPVAIFI